MGAQNSELASANRVIVYVTMYVGMNYTAFVRGQYLLGINYTIMYTVKTKT